MFEKKCPRCKSKVARNFSYCPYCSFELSKKESDSLLDNVEEFDEFESGMDETNIEELTKEIGKSMGFDFIDRFPFNHIVKKLSKDIEKQFKDIDKSISEKKIKGKEEVTRKDGTEIKRTTFPGGFSIQIRLGGTPEQIHIPMGMIQPSRTSEKQPVKKIILAKQRKLSDKAIEKIAKLPRAEPETKVRRLTDKIIYEIYMPGVKSLKDIAVNKLENSIEIKAISKDRAYFKLIPIALPLIRYYLKNELLFLELKP